MENQHLCSFEKKIIQGFENSNISLNKIKDVNESIGVAVSGGADSISLLTALTKILSFYKISLKVITVNHYIRADEETCGDVNFVVDTCQNFISKGFDVKCHVKNLKKGEVFDLAKKNKYSIEEAARFLRYKLFDKFIEEENISYLCLAHNKNDNLETLIMRFLQGASVENAIGIPEKREKYFRPMLDITRNEIEDYLKINNQNWRTDSTNFDTNYLRNKIRNKLIPFLDNEFEGWQTGVLKGAEKNHQDKEIIDNAVGKINIVQNQNGVEFSRDEFRACFDGVKNRVLLKAFNLCGIDARIPYVFLKDIIESEKNTLIEKKYSKSFGNIEIQFKNHTVFVKKTIKESTEMYFSAIIEEDSEIFLPIGKINFSKNNEKIEISFDDFCVSLKCNYPLRIRNFFWGDEIKEKSGNLKKINDIFSDWHVDEEYKSLIPLIEEINRKDNKIICILGSFLGFKNWIV